MTAPASKISDLVAAQGDEPWIAFEYYPPRTEKGVANLYKRLESMKELGKLKPACDGICTHSLCEVSAKEYEG